MRIYLLFALRFALLASVGIGVPWGKNSKNQKPVREFVESTRDMSRRILCKRPALTIVSLKVDPWLPAAIAPVFCPKLKNSVPGSRVLNYWRLRRRCRSNCNFRLTCVDFRLLNRVFNGFCARLDWGRLKILLKGPGTKALPADITFCSRS